MAEQDERLGQLMAEKNSLENSHPMAAKLLQDGKDVITAHRSVQQDGGQKSHDFNTDCQTLNQSID